MIYLRDQRRAWLNGAPQSGLFIGGQKVWAAAAPDSPLAPFYGTGPGQIILHLDPMRAVMSGVQVATIPNSGGAGAAMDATAEGAITRRGALLEIQASLLQTAAPVDLAQARLLMVIESDTPLNNRQYLGRNVGTGDGDRVGFNWQPGSARTLPQRWNGSTNTQIVVSGLTFGTDLTVVEMELSGGQFRCWINGVATAAVNSAWPDLIVDSFFGVNNPVPNFVGIAGDVLAVRSGGDGDAIAAGRAYLFGKHGIAMA